MEIREATHEDWPRIWPIFSATVQAGETYTYDERLTSDQAAELWLEAPPGATVVAVEDGRVLGTAKRGPNGPAVANTRAVRLWKTLGFEVIGTVPGAFRHPEQGYVGLHVMFLPLA